MRLDCGQKSLILGFPFSITFIISLRFDVEISLENGLE